MTPSTYDLEILMNGNDALAANEGWVCGDVSQLEGWALRSPLSGDPLQPRIFVPPAPAQVFETQG